MKDLLQVQEGSEGPPAGLVGVGRPPAGLDGVKRITQRSEMGRETLQQVWEWSEGRPKVSGGVERPPRRSRRG